MGLINPKDEGCFVLARTYHAVIPRWSAAGLCWTVILSTPGSILPPPFVEDGPPPPY